tara:strand:- start:3516 stop:3827 length:312 start_codon:yes stop_codon:yes gene_type:complete
MNTPTWIKRLEDEVLFADGFDEAILGIARRAAQPDVVAYNYEKCVQVLIDRDDMTEEDAREFMEFNVVGAFVGEGTPVFIEPHVPNAMKSTCLVYQHPLKTWS